jgi:uncharacterized repeat protein (TIGR01451 family)
MYARRVWVLVVFVSLTALAASESQQTSAIGSHGPFLSVTIMRPGNDWRAITAPGQLATISIGVSNLQGDADAHNATLTVLLPAGLTLKQSTPAPDKIASTKSAASLTWNLGIVPAGAFPRLFDLDLQTANDVVPGHLLGVAASMSTSDRTLSDINSRNAIVFLVAPAAANLVVQSDIDSVPFTPLTYYTPVEFTTEVTNLGTIPASACVLKMTLSQGATFKSSDPPPANHSDNQAVWNLGDIAVNQSRPIKIKIGLNSNLRPPAFALRSKADDLHFTFDASTTTNQLTTARNHLETTRYVEAAGSNLRVSLNVLAGDHPGELPIGKDVTYEIVYGNYGNAPAKEVSVSLMLPDGLAMVDAQPPGNSSNKSGKPDGGVFSWSLGDLGVGRSGVVKSKVHVTSVGPDGSFVWAKISAAGHDDVPSQGKTAYSLRYAEKR